MRNRNSNASAWIAFASVIGLIAVLGIFWAIPQYHIYSMRMDGEAALEYAKGQRQIAALDAQALIDKSKGQAQAEVERARGIAEANKIVSESLKGQQEYLTYLWIDALRENQGGQIIYIPNDGSIPITEAGRATTPVQPQAP